MAIEFFVQFFLEVVVELLIQSGFHGTGKVLRSSIGRVAVSAGVGFAFGVWWGARLADQGSGNRPVLFSVSVLAAAVLGVAAVYRWTAADRAAPVVGDRSLESLVAPWRWPANRLAAFAVLNAAVAAGIATGWHPPPLA